MYSSSERFVWSTLALHSARVMPFWKFEVLCLRKSWHMMTRFVQRETNSSAMEIRSLTTRDEVLRHMSLLPQTSTTTGQGASGECSSEQRVCRTHFPCRPKSFTIFPRMHMSLPRWNFSRCSSKLLPATIIEDCLLAISICMYKSPPSDRFEGACLSELYTCKRNTVISWVHVQPHFTLMYNNSVYNDSISYQSRIMP